MFSRCLWGLRAFLRGSSTASPIEKYVFSAVAGAAFSLFFESDALRSALAPARVFDATRPEGL